jgi:MFS family permease
LVVSIFTLGGLIGSLGSNAITKPLGRVNTLRISAGCIMFGSTVVGLANHLSLMIIGRILIGLGCGLATVTVPLFLAEIAPPSIKKSLGIMNQLFIVFGMLAGQSLSFPFSHEARWRYVFAVAVVIGVVQLLGSFFITDGEKVKDDEEEPLLGQEVEPLSIKGLLTTNDSRIRRACRFCLCHVHLRLTASPGGPDHSDISTNMRYLTRHVLFHPYPQTRL